MAPELIIPFAPYQGLGDKRNGQSILSCFFKNSAYTF